MKCSCTAQIFRGWMWPELWNPGISACCIAWVSFSGVGWGCNLHRAYPYNSYSAPLPWYFHLWTNIASQSRDHEASRTDSSELRYLSRYWSWSKGSKGVSFFSLFRSTYSVLGPLSLSTHRRSVKVPVENPRTYHSRNWEVKRGGNGELTAYSCILRGVLTRTS